MLLLLQQKKVRDDKTHTHFLPAGTLVQVYMALGSTAEGMAWRLPLKNLRDCAQFWLLSPVLRQDRTRKPRIAYKCSQKNILSKVHIYTD